MQISSPAFINETSIPQKYTCQGEGVNPPLDIQKVLEEAKSIVLIVDDPDAPMGLFTHWVIWHIDPAVQTIDEDSIPQGAMEGVNSSGGLGWMAPCPPEGTGVHHYRFTLFALSEDLDIEEGATRDEVENAMKDMVIDKAELVGVYPPESNHSEIL